MTDKELDEVRLRIADVIVSCNLVEKEMKNIISAYINSKRSFFVSEILLNNMTINLGVKRKVIEYIIKEEKIEVDKDYNKGLHIIMNKRNMIAHSDSVLDNHQIVDVDVSFEHDGAFYEPVFEEAEPLISTIESGKYRYEAVSKICTDFEKYYKIVSAELSKVLTRVNQLSTN